MLLYALLHLTGYDLAARASCATSASCTARRRAIPKCGVTPGVETTTGPLGQGLTNAVGMALAEKLLAAEFNRDGHAIVDHHTYVFLGDGCLMEGISHEACALAGAWKLEQADRASTTTTASRSTARSRPGSSTTRRSASRPTAGT